MQIDFWQTARGDKVVEQEILNLRDPKLQKRIVRNLDYLKGKQDIVPCLASKDFKKIVSSHPPIYEIITYKTRILFCIKNSICWLLTLFQKDDQKTRKYEIEKAQERAKDIFKNYN